jgi:hypothetical protein
LLRKENEAPIQARIASDRAPTLHRAGKGDAPISMMRCSFTFFTCLYGGEAAFHKIAERFYLTNRRFR